MASEITVEIDAAQILNNSLLLLRMPPRTSTATLHEARDVLQRVVNDLGVHAAVIVITQEDCDLTFIPERDLRKAGLMRIAGANP